MPLSPHTRLGPYEILSAIGAGGMGEVYKARDTRLDRIVAIKVLPEDRHSSPQARERFEREAKAVSSLSHPHICTLHDVGHQDGIDFLVMEYLEGQTLADRLKKGPIPLEQVSQYAIQITDALDAAHRHGVIHRDLKPGNIMLTKSGAKLLDFGLAKVRVAEAVTGMTALPTQTTPLTGEGTILGTLQYMAPEQLEGKEADARTDIFALGAVIYEMATGRKAFDGKSHASLIAAILEREPPPISTLQPLTPPAMEHVVRRCVAKDPEDRWQTARELLHELKWIAEACSQAEIPTRPTTQRRTRELLPWSIVAALSIALLALSIVHFRRHPAESPTVRFQVPLPDKVSLNWHDFPVISPDGRHLVFAGIGSDGVRHLWLHSLDSLADQLVAGGEDGYLPFWSPDSRSIAFFSKDKLKRTDVTGGPPRTICDVKYPNGGGAWDRDDVILLSEFSESGIHRVSAAGGEPQPVLQLDKSRQEIAQVLPQFLPDGRHFLYLSRSARAGQGAIYLGSLDSKEDRMLISTESNASYVSPGFLIYARAEILLAQPFDPTLLRVTGEPVPIAENVGRGAELGLALFSISTNGILAYSSRASKLVQLAWHNRQGARLSSVGEPGIYEEPVLSPDEKRLAVRRIDAETSNADIWLLELSSGILSRVTLHSYAGSALWSRDGRELLINESPNGHLDLYRKEIGGGDEQLVFQNGKNIFAPQWLGDGSVLFNTGKAFCLLPPSGVRKSVVLLESEFAKDDPVVSPDGRWVAYQATESGRWEIYIAAFPSFKEKRQVSNSGGCQPHWRRSDGKELVYLGLDGKMMSVDVRAGSTLETGAPKPLFQVPFRIDPDVVQFEITGDGKRFLFGEPVGEGTKPLTVVLNWTAGLKH